MGLIKSHLLFLSLLFLCPKIHGLERAFSGEYLYETRKGTYVCIKCSAPLFSSKDKYDSGAGWPCFLSPIQKNAVYYIKDDAYGLRRYRVHCIGCSETLGHVFHDGPPPKNLRYCIASSSLSFHIEGS